MSNENAEKENINPSITNCFSEHDRWISEKKKELSAIVVAGDVSSVTRQIDNQKRFKAEIDDRYVQIEKTFELHSGEHCGSIWRPCP